MDLADGRTTTQTSWFRDDDDGIGWLVDYLCYISAESECRTDASAERINQFSVPQRAANYSPCQSTSLRAAANLIPTCNDKSQHMHCRVSISHGILHCSNTL